ncbi:MAG: hypothetical protein CMH49_04005 [Myxococcales bacterium]|nr:hypothetical protein [Myxococcales bacterium]
MSQLDLFPKPKQLLRSEAVELLKTYLHKDLRQISDQLGLTQKDQAISNYGWAGHTVEWLLGSSPNNHQAADFGEWELKVTNLERLKVQTKSSFSWRVRNHIALTGVQAADLIKTPFEQSHLYEKTNQLLIVGREYLDSEELSSPLVTLCEYDLKEATFDKIKQEYESIQWALREFGLMGLKASQGEYLGLQQGSGTRGSARFIARKTWVEEMFANGLRHEL